MIESPCPTLMGRIPHRSSSRQLGEAFARKVVSSLLDSQMRIRRTPSRATLLLKRRWANTSDGWEPAWANQRADRRRSCWAEIKFSFLETLLWRQWSSRYGTGLWLRRSGFHPGCGLVHVPDPSQIGRFSQEDVRHLVHTTCVLTIPSSGKQM